MKKETCCPALWMHLHVINDGRAFPCCMTPLEDKNSLGNVNNESIIQIMNSAKAKEMRANMIAGNPLPPSCHRCTEKEALGMNSMRIGLVDNYLTEIEDKIANTHIDGSIDKVELIYWDFRFSNFCNLSCRTCTPMFSTSWDKDFKVLWNSNSKASPLINLENAPLFWQDLEEQIQYVKSIHFAGGEPTIMEEHWRLIDMLIEKGLTDIEMHYTINATKMFFKGRSIVDVWKKFKSVHLSISIDGVYDTFDYVRNRGHWPEVEQNLLAIKDAGVKYWIHPTISVLNIYRITELHDKLIEMGMIGGNRRKNMQNYFITQFHLNPLFTPDYYCLTSLPAEHKIAVEKMLREYADRMFDTHGIAKDGWLSLIDFMNAQDTSNRWPKFIEMTNRLDELRGQDFTLINPEFKNDFAR